MTTAEGSTRPMFVPGGQGLGNLRERALAIGGRVEVDSHPGEGTPVRVELPRP
jgi:signal transduction histidine kinase